MLIDAPVVREQMTAVRESDPWLLECLQFQRSAVEVLEASARVAYKGTDVVVQNQLVVMQTLAIRVLNSIASADTLLVHGYFQQVAMMVRDVMECSFLLDLFSRQPQHLQPWIDLGLQAGKTAYSPVKVRQILEQMDGPDGAVRKKHYEFYSSHGTHPNSVGLLFIAPDNAVEIGPFADHQRFLGLTNDLTLFSVLAATHLGVWHTGSGIDLMEGAPYDTFVTALAGIKERFLTVSAHLKTVKGMAEEQGPSDGEPVGS